MDRVLRIYRTNERGDNCKNHSRKKHRGADTGGPGWEEEDGIQSFRQEAWALILYSCVNNSVLNSFPVFAYAIHELLGYCIIEIEPIKLKRYL